ncbi:MurR/RpiR family transcriptional regulator [Oryzifoliimicrobium ureilyticus]|uniref:MurR/RpiR family transcriptional regulator n=1 Tax=Oryzifoliimicrobium ureilyticus TaxID=3113724 RepID=UPI0030760FBA
MTGNDLPTTFERPRTLEELRALTVDIRRGETGLSLGSKALDVLSRLVDIPEQAAVRSISELSAALGVNPSTLTRLAQRLGYGGFNDFQGIFREAITDDERYFYSRQAGRLISARKGDGEEHAVLVRLAIESKANIDGFLAQLDDGHLRHAAALLAHAPRIRVYGVRQFHAFASFLTYGLSMLRDDVGLLDSPRLGEAEGLAQLSAGDVLVVASCAPYTRNVADVATIAARYGIRVIAVTDTRSSPLVAPSEHAFFVPHASSFFSNSMGAYVVFCEGLLNLVAGSLGETAVNALARREALIKDLRIEADSP